MSGLTPQNFQIALPGVPGGFQQVAPGTQQVIQGQNFGTEALSRLAASLGTDISAAVTKIQTDKQTNKQREEYALGVLDYETARATAQTNRDAFTQATASGQIGRHQNPWRQTGREVMYAQAQANELYSASLQQFDQNPLQDPEQFLDAVRKTALDARQGLSPQIANSQYLPKLGEVEKAVREASFKAREKEHDASVAQQIGQLGAGIAVRAETEKDPVQFVSDQITQRSRDGIQLGFAPSEVNSGIVEATISQALLTTDTTKALAILDGIGRAETSPGSFFSGIPGVAAKLAAARDDISGRKLKLQRQQLEVEALEQDAFTDKAIEFMAQNSSTAGGLQEFSFYVQQFPNMDVSKALSFYSAVRSQTQTVDSGVVSQTELAAIEAKAMLGDPTAIQEARDLILRGRAPASELPAVQRLIDKANDKGSDLYKIGPLFTNPAVSAGITNLQSQIGSSINAQTTFLPDQKAKNKMTTTAMQTAFKAELTKRVSADPKTYFQPDGKTPNYAAISALSENIYKTVEANEPLVQRGFLSPDQSAVDPQRARQIVAQKVSAVLSGHRGDPWVTNDTEYKKAVQEYKDTNGASGIIARSAQSIRDYYRFTGKTQPEYLKGEVDLGVIRKYFKNLQAPATPTTQPKTVSSLGDLKNPANARQYAEKLAATYGLPKGLMSAMMEQESSNRHDAISPVSGAYGYFQLMPAAAKDIRVNRFNVQDNVKGGVAYFASVYKRYNGNIPLALAAYNAGPNNPIVKSGRIPQNGETPTYVKNILAYQKKYQGV